jgi:glycerol dehydrogenase
MTQQQGWQGQSGRSFGSPGRYVQRAGEIDRLHEQMQGIGSKAFVLIDGFLFASLKERVMHSVTADGIEAKVEKFGGECCTPEIERVTELVREAAADVVVAVGGGKTIDTAKLAAIATGARIVVVPTIASTDAPCSAIAVRYSREGIYQESHFLPRNPDLVVIDSAVVASAPARFLVAGIGDALSTWFEARSNLESRSGNFVRPGLPAPVAGVAIAKACQEVLLRDGLAAKLAVERGALTPAVENIIEANTLLSGLGFENCGVSAAHGIHDGLTVLPGVHGFYHGEKVAFGVLCLLMLEGRPLAEIEEIARFCISVGLPVRLADLNLADATPDDILKVAEAALKPGSAIYRVAVPLSVEIVRDAILALDAFTSTLK